MIREPLPSRADTQENNLVVPSPSVCVLQTAHSHLRLVFCPIHQGKCSCLHFTDGETTLVAQMVKNLPAVKKIQVRSLGGEDLLEKGMATHSSILAWRIPWAEEPGGLQSIGSQRVRPD